MFYRAYKDQLKKMHIWHHFCVGVRQTHEYACYKYKQLMRAFTILVSFLYGVWQLETEIM